MNARPPLGRMPDGTLYAYTSIGCYPLIYVDSKSGDVLCAECASQEPVQPDADVYWEGPPLHCDECSETIESAYGDPDDESTEDSK